MKKTHLYWLIAAIVLIGVPMGYWAYYMSQPGKHDQFAQCLTDSGIKFYGAFWCPHCQEQKAMFGKSEKLLPYVECSTPDGNSQTQACTDIGIESYPTWILSDGARLNGTQQLATLAERTSCQLP